jgi:hypothetical protein
MELELSSESLIACLENKGAQADLDKIFNIASQLGAVDDREILELILAHFLCSDGVTGETYVFNATTDWAGPAAGAYTFTTPVSTREVGIVQVWEDLGGGNFVVNGVQADTETTGNTVIITVPEVPDGRFAGKIKLVRF